MWEGKQVRKLEENEASGTTAAKDIRRSTAHTKSLIISGSLPNISCLDFNKKVNDMLESKEKHSLKRQESIRDRLRHSVAFRITK